MSNTICTFCGAENNENSRHCQACGALIGSDEIAVKVCTPKAKKSLGNLKPSFVVKNALLLALSIILLVFSFLPVYSVSVDPADEYESYIDGKITLKISSIDAIVFWFDSLKELDDEDIQDSELYENLQESTEDLYQEFEDLYSDSDADKIKLTSMQEATLSKIFVQTIRLSLQHESSETGGYMTLAMIISFIYIALSATLFILCLVSFIRLLLGKRAWFVPCLKLMLWIPLAAVLLYLCVRPYFLSLNVSRSTMGIAGIVSVILCLVFVCYLFVDRHIRVKQANVSGIIKNAISLVCATVVLFMLLSPVLNTKITTVFKGGTSEKTANATLSADYFAFLDKNEEHAMFEELNFEEGRLEFSAFSAYSRRDITSGKADTSNVVFLTQIIASVLRIDLLKLFALVFYVFVFVGVCAGAVAIQNLIYLCTGEKSRWITVIFKILGAVGTVVILATAIVFCFPANWAAEQFDIEKNYAVSIAVAPIVMSVFALIAACIPSKDTKIKYIVEQEPSPIEETVE